MTWHDRSENSSGILSSTLAQDVQTLNGVSTEVLSVYMESSFAMFGGIIIALIFSWKVALVAIAVSPLMIIGGVIGAKIDAGNAGSDNDSNQIIKNDETQKSKDKTVLSPELLANDAINNYRTVAGFSLQRGIVDQYCQLLLPEYNTAKRNSHIAGVVYGYSKFIENSAIAIILYFGTLIMLNDDDLDGEKVFIAIFAMIFGAFGAGNASAYGPDAEKGKKAAMKVFMITDTPSTINAYATDES